MSDLLDREGILELLRQFGGELVDRGLEADVYVVGGTAMVVAYDRLCLTQDVGAVGAEIEPDWFDDRIRLLPRVVDVDRVEAFSAPGISVSVASARHMLAMKVRAARDARDLSDIRLLSQELRLDSIAAVLDIAKEVWGPDMIREENIFLVTEFLRDEGFRD